jgi:hypothetical protein
MALINHTTGQWNDWMQGVTASFLRTRTQAWNSGNLAFEAPAPNADKILIDHSIVQQTDLQGLMSA